MDKTLEAKHSSYFCKGLLLQRFYVKKQPYSRLNHERRGTPKLNPIQSAVILLVLETNWENDSQENI